VSKRQIRAKGREELQRHLDGRKLTHRQAILANCYECVGGYVDGKRSCHIPRCPLYPFMPYRDID